MKEEGVKEERGSKEKRKKEGTRTKRERPNRAYEENWRKRRKEKGNEARGIREGGRGKQTKED